MLQRAHALLLLHAMLSNDTSTSIFLDAACEMHASDMDKSMSTLTLY